ncbi:hypothetical protein ACHAXH_007728 [Discostella pseudostelligera]
MITAGGGSGDVGDGSGVGDASAQSSIISTNSEQPEDFIDAYNSDLRARIDRITDTIESSHSTSTTSNRNKRSRCSSGNNGNDSRKGSQQQLSANFFSYPSYRVTAATAAAVGGGGIHNRAPSYVANHVLRQELSLLNLLNFLCDGSDMDIPINDPSLFQPTPFAPGEDAHTLQLEQQRVHEPVVLASVSVPVAGTRLVAKVPVQVPVAMMPFVPLLVSVPLPIPAAVVAAALVAEVPVPVPAATSAPLAPAMPTTTVPFSQFPPALPDQPVLSLLQQLCAANFFGGYSSRGSSISNNNFPPQSPPLSLPYARQADQIVPSHQYACNNVQPIVWNPPGGGGGFDLNQLLISAGVVVPPLPRPGIGAGIELFGDNAGNAMNTSINNNNNNNRMMLMPNPTLPISSSLPFTTTTATPSSTVLPDTYHNNAIRTVSIGYRPVKSRPPSAAAATTSSRGTDKKPTGGKGTIKNREYRWILRYNDLLEVNDYLCSFTPFPSGQLHVLSSSINQSINHSPLPIHLIRTISVSLFSSSARAFYFFPVSFRPWSLPRPARLPRQPQTSLVGHEPTCPICSPISGQKDLVDRGSDPNIE